jgi:CRISPR-associated protein Cst1
MPVITLDRYMNQSGVENHTKDNDKSKFYWTGHPFVDAGLVAILLIANKTKPEELTKEDVEKAIEFASKLYAKKEWATSYLHGKIFPNNGIIMSNPGMSKKRTPENIAKNLMELYNNISDVLDFSSKEKRCIICGRRKPYEKDIYRSDFPLLGTGGMLNFFHSANPKGEDICAYCLFLVQFMPLVAYNLPNVLVIHAYPYEKMLELCKESFDYAREYSLISNARDFKKPENFLFRKIIEITRRAESKSKFWENVSITLYYFRNGNRSGEQYVDIIHIPTSALRFIAFAGEKDYDGWKNILNMGWIISKTKREKLNFEELEKSYPNEVYRRLLNEESILEFFYDKKEKKVNAKWKLLEFYCLEVLGLDEKTLEFIKDVGDRIVETIEKLEDNKLRQTVRELENATKLYQFENFFIRVEKIRQQKGIPKSLLTFDEFARLLTSYGEDINTSWRVVRDLLLFRIYEKLHDRLIKAQTSESESEEEEEIYEGDEE